MSFYFYKGKENTNTRSLKCNKRVIKKQDYSYKRVYFSIFSYFQ